MKKAIEFLRSKKIKVTETGKITSKLPNGEAGISLVYELEENTEDNENECCYTIIGNQLSKIDI